MKSIPSLSAIVLACLLPATLPGSVYAQPVDVPSPASATVSYGVVESVTPVEHKSGTSGAGAVIGGVMGGVLGHQFGSGKGNAVTTIGGAAGGAYLGNKVEQSRQNPNTSYQITVRMDSGDQLTFNQADGSFQPGDHVMIRSGSVYHQ